MNEIARFLQGIIDGDGFNVLALVSLVGGIVLYIFLSEPIKEIRERLLKQKSLKREIELLKSDLIKSLRREADLTERAERACQLSEAAIIRCNDMHWLDIEKTRKIVDLEREMGRLRFRRVQRAGSSAQRAQTQDAPSAKVSRR